MNQSNSLHDQSNSFGWISIALHWLIAALVTTLWFIGKSIDFQLPEDVLQQRQLHITIGLISWIFIAGRVCWRIKNKHPRAIGQTDTIHRLAKAAHYILLVLLTIMLVTGPILAWAETSFPNLTTTLHLIHSATANLLAVLVLIHIAGALKHFMFHDDETMARIFAPRR